MAEQLDLTVSVSADEWALVNRRIAFLEAMMLRIIRSDAEITEWYRADELESLRLPGLPVCRFGADHNGRQPILRLRLSHL